MCHRHILTYLHAFFKKNSTRKSCVSAVTFIFILKQWSCKGSGSSTSKRSLHSCVCRKNKFRRSVLLNFNSHILLIAWVSLLYIFVYYNNKHEQELNFNVKRLTITWGKKYIENWIRAILSCPKESHILDATRFDRYLLIPKCHLHEKTCFCVIVAWYIYIYIYTNQNF